MLPEKANVFPTYEISHKPWFGPKKRAKDHLLKRTLVLTPQEAVLGLQEVLGQHFVHIQHIRFIDYLHTVKHDDVHGGQIRGNRGESGFRYTIAVIWADSNEDVRQAIYECAAEMIRKTGWYPLPQGERISSKKALRDFQNEIGWFPKREFAIAKPFLSLTSAVTAEGGCAIRLRTASNSLLLDTGLPGALHVDPFDCAVLLTHFHRDHLGGILSGTTGNLPVVMSETTAQVLLGLNLVSGEYLCQCAIVLPFGQPLVAGDVIVTPFPVPHCPGSTGFEIDDGENLLLYPGDLVLRTSRHDYLTELVDRVKRSGTHRCRVLLDATMAGRPYGASSSTTAADVFKHTPGYKDVVVISRDVEQLVYAYLDLFNRAKSTDTSRHKAAFLLSPRLRSTFQVLHSAFIDHSFDNLDPILSAQYGKSLSSWAESRWLFWIDRMASIPEDKLRFWFISEDEVPYVRPIGRVGILLVGRLENFSNWHWIEETTVLQIDTSPWTLHSDETTLTEGIVKLSEWADIILFHNFTGRLKKYLKSHGLKADVISDAPIILRGRNA